MSKNIQQYNGLSNLLNNTLAPSFGKLRNDSFMCETPNFLPGHSSSVVPHSLLTSGQSSVSSRRPDHSLLKPQQNQRGVASTTQGSTVPNTTSQMYQNMAQTQLAKATKLLQKEVSSTSLLTAKPALARSISGPSQVPSTREMATIERQNSASKLQQDVQSFNPTILIH